MINRPNPRDTHGAGTSDPALAPETHNAEQDDEAAQAQTVAEDARNAVGLASGDSEKVGSGEDDGGTLDLVDHMRQMVSSGRIDMSAFRGERSDDDDEHLLGDQGLEDDFPRGAE